MTHESMAKRLIKVGVWGGGLVVSYKAGTDALRYRPLGDDSEMSATRRYQLDAIHDGTQVRGIDLKDGNPWGWIVARATTMALGAAICKMVMSVGNQTNIFRDEKHERWLGLVRGREDGVPLITVSNHESCFDDPGVMSVIVPWDVAANPKKMRWGICTQDICFPDNSFIQAVAGAGQALPIKRGGGIDQPLFLDVARHVAAGHWVHVFPEGRVIQTGELGLDVLTPRGPRELERVGRLKWGVGKLIAHSPYVPVVIPMHHTGMPNVMPQHNVWRPDKHNGWWFDNRWVFVGHHATGQYVAS